jgi:hypothetical protein
MGKCTLLEKFEDEYLGISYAGEIFYDEVNRNVFCKIYSNIEGFSDVFQKDSYRSAVSEVENRIKEYLAESKIEKSSKRFLIIPISEDETWGIEEYYQDLEKFDNTQWICVYDFDVVMSEISPGIWEYEGKYHIAIETNLSNNYIPNELDTVLKDALKSMCKTITKKVRAFEKKTLKEK